MAHPTLPAHSFPKEDAPDTRRTASPTFERIVAAAGLARRARQDRAVDLAHDAVTRGQRVVIQAPTGVGKSFIALATAADAGEPGTPGIVVTTTNALGDQYLRDCQRAAALAGFTYTRVMGARHYACADSEMARAEGVPGKGDIPDGGDVDEWKAQATTRREEWLRDSTVTDADPAVRWERRPAGLGDQYACPGYPDCAGNALGGCGSKLARARGFDVAVVISNFHVLAYAHKLDMPLVPLADAAVVIVDEAHELPGVVAEIDGGHLTENTGARVFAKHPKLAETAAAWIGASLDAVTFGRSRHDTDAPVPVDLATRDLFTGALMTLPAEVRDKLLADRAVDEGQFAAGDVLSLLRAFYTAGRASDTWRAWTERSLDKATDEWSESRVVQLRRTDAAERIVPTMLPPAAVFLTGTVGDTLPARLGLPDADVVDLGQEFDWTQVTGRISAISGVKTGDWKTEVLPRYRARSAELADAIRPHRAALILANAHEDVSTITRQLAPLLPGWRLFAQERGTGSLGAAATKEQYVSHVKRGGRGVLVGVNSFATGLDLPGELCTFVAWWACHKGVTGYYDGQVDRRYDGYLEERFRSRFAQGLGRLLRSHDDRGEVMICDSRGDWHVRTATTRVDSHLSSITWTGVAA